MAMRVIHHSHCGGGPGTATIVAGPAQGVQHFEVATERLEPGAESPRSRHDGELVAVALAGCGKLIVDGGPQRFHAPCTLLLPRDAEFRVVNNGAVVLQLVWVGAPAHRRETP